MTDVFERFETDKWYSINVNHKSFWAQLRAARREKLEEMADMRTQRERQAVAYRLAKDGEL
ncbi:MAG: hypothetical protein PHY54_20105 [Methylococcales bacterium]|nr:hypothetical protein [Methylococcales bacterium]